MKIKNQNIKFFLNEVSDKKSTPGGGAVAALAGAMAASLVEMVVSLTKKGNLENYGKKAHVLKEKLLYLADEDVKAFNEVMNSYKTKNKIRIMKSLNKATQVPQETLELSSRVEELAKIVIKKGNKNAISDAKTGVFLAKAAQKSAMENVKINLKVLKRINHKIK